MSDAIDQTSGGLFRIGPGFVSYWMHEVTHWDVEQSLVIAARDLDESLRRLIVQRDAVETARRAFIPVSSLAVDAHPSDGMQQVLFRATHDFYQTYYSALSAFASFLTRFRKELGDVPHSTMSKFLNWLDSIAMFKEETIPLLQEARRFRALMDHKQSHQPYDWATQNLDGTVRIALHGPPNANGAVPDGAMPLLDDDHEQIPEEHSWVFVAPDEDRVLASLALQLNAAFPRIQVHRANKKKMRECTWELQLGEGDPASGYPILAAMDGVVVSAGQEGIVLSDEDRAKIDDILAPYFKRDEDNDDDGKS